MVEVATSAHPIKLTVMDYPIDFTDSTNLHLFTPRHNSASTESVRTLLDLTFSQLRAMFPGACECLVMNDGLPFIGLVTSPLLNIKKVSSIHNNLAECRCVTYHAKVYRIDCYKLLMNSASWRAEFHLSNLEITAIRYENMQDRLHSVTGVMTNATNSTNCNALTESAGKLQYSTPVWRPLHPHQLSQPSQMAHNPQLPQLPQFPQLQPIPAVSQNISRSASHNSLDNSAAIAQMKRTYLRREIPRTGAIFPIPTHHYTGDIGHYAVPNYSLSGGKHS